MVNAAVKLLCLVAFLVAVIVASKDASNKHPKERKGFFRRGKKEVGNSSVSMTELKKEANNNKATDVARLTKLKPLLGKLSIG